MRRRGREHRRQVRFRRRHPADSRRPDKPPMSERCVDASVMVKLALKGESRRITARRLVLESTEAGIQLIAPPIFPSEVDTVIRKRVHEGRLSQPGAQEAYGVLDRSPVEIVTRPDLRRRARQIAEQFNQPAVYDATYAALAELRGCEFWTADKAFYDAVKDGLPFVKYLPDCP
ncbi:MAG: type II toxin-antitoxin system VapC family toxin [Planctomycetes bacterium]|nr:type II toxin-antitoxin system VapC family toxin [Planctomycetota bacterium]